MLGVANRPNAECRFFEDLEMEFGPVIAVAIGTIEFVVLLAYLLFGDRRKEE